MLGICYVPWLFFVVRGGRGRHVKRIVLQLIVHFIIIIIILRRWHQIMIVNLFPGKP